MYSLNETLERLMVAQDKLMADLKSQLNFDTLAYVSNLTYGWEEIMNWPPSEKNILFGEYIQCFKIIKDLEEQKLWWKKYQDFDNAFNWVNQVVGIEVSAKVVIELNIKPFLEAKRDHNYFKSLVFLSKFYKIVKFNFLLIFDKPESDIAKNIFLREVVPYQKKLDNGEKGFFIDIFNNSIEPIPFQCWEDVAKYFLKFCKDSNDKYNADIQMGLPPNLTHLWDD